MELELLGRALASSHGIVIRLLQPSDVEAMRQRLYKTKRHSEEFQFLSFTTDPSDPTALWIVKTGGPDGPR